MANETARILTTVVGSYPVPDWLVASPSTQALIDATRVVLHTQEAAGIDLVCDGELYRFDVNHPETNGMIEYFVRPMAGMRTEIDFVELQAFRGQAGMGFRRQPPAVVDGPIEAGTLDLPGACGRALALAGTATQVHGHRAAHAGQDGDQPPLPRRREPRRGDRGRARRPGRPLPGSGSRPARRGQPAGAPGRMGVGGALHQPGPRRGAGHPGRAPLLRQLRRPDHPVGELEPAYRLP